MNRDYAMTKALYEGMITLYGRKTVLTLLQDTAVDVHRLHIASSNRKAPLMDEIMALARQRNIDVREHDRSALSRISRNQRQDQGVAIDLTAPAFQPLGNLVPDPAKDLLVIDGVTNPQNLGMILRSVAASPLQGVILPAAATAKPDPLVWKASSGCLLKAPIYYCDTTLQAIEHIKHHGVTVNVLDAAASVTISEVPVGGQAFVAGNESHGVSAQIAQHSDRGIAIPLANNVESLNVSIAAALIAFRSLF